MTIKRRNITNSINSGNFGRPGTPLPLTKQRKGPNFGRLLQTLGVVADDVAGQMQEDNEAAAGAAIREVLVNTKGQSREAQAEAINNVREQFEDQGVFLNAWSKENPAVQTIDKINGRAHALTTRATINQIMSDTVGQSLEDRQNKVLQAIQEAGTFTRGISDASHESYMEAVTDYALKADDQLTAQESIRVRTENKNKVYNNYVLESEEILNTLAGNDSESMNTDPESFRAGQTTMDDEEIQGNFKDVIAINGRDLYKDALAIGASKEEASESVANYVHHMAKKYNRPEIIEYGMDIPLSNRLKLKDVHGAQLDKAQESVAQSQARKAASFKQQAEIQRNKEFKAQYQNTYNDNEVLVNSAKDNSDDPSKAQEALTSFRQQREELIETQENYRDNPDHFGRMLSMLNHNIADVTDAVGDPQVETEAVDRITRGVMTADWYLENANKIDNITKSKVRAYLDGERKADTANAAQHIKNVKAIQAYEIEAGTLDSIDAYEARIENDVTKLQIATQQNLGTIGHVITSRDIKDAGWRAVRELDASQFNETGKAQAPHEDRVKAYNDAANKKLDEATKLIDQLEGRIQQQQQQEAPEGRQETPINVLDSAIEKAGSVSDQDEITFEEAQALQEIPAESFDNPQDARRVKQVATVAVIRNSPDITVEGAIRQVVADFQRAGDKFDPLDSDHLQKLKDILVSGFGRTKLNQNLAKGVTTFDQERRTLSDFISDIDDLSSETTVLQLESIIAPEQLGRIDKIKDMLKLHKVDRALQEIEAENN